jgi:hypothetical protein
MSTSTVSARPPPCLPGRVRPSALRPPVRTAVVRRYGRCGGAVSGLGHAGSTWLPASASGPVAFGTEPHGGSSRSYWGPYGGGGRGPGGCAWWRSTAWPCRPGQGFRHAGCLSGEAPCSCTGCIASRACRLGWDWMASHPTLGLDRRRRPRSVVIVRPRGRVGQPARGRDSPATSAPTGGPRLSRRRAPSFIGAVCDQHA